MTGEIGYDMTRRSVARAGEAPTLPHDIEALGLVAAILAVVLILCLVGPVSAGAI